MDDLDARQLTKRRMRFMLICFAILFGAIFLSKFIKSAIINYFMASASHVVTVSTIKATKSLWQPQIKAAASVRATLGVNVTTEVAGMIQKIYLIPGSVVKAGDILVQLNANSETGALQALEANAALAQITYERDKKQYAIHAVSKQTLDADYQNLLSLRAQVFQQTATLNKKTIRAPFAGRLGISMVNPGQYLNTGDKVVTLQTFDPIYVDFYIPQQELPRIKAGESINVTTDSHPGKIFTGPITTIDPAIDVNTRNVQVEATLPNPNQELTPGMFVTAEIKVGNAEPLITLPQTAIIFNPYGDVVYVVRPGEKDKKGQHTLIAKQVFVVTGDTRGDQITVLKGIKEGDTVVTSGQLKLKNGSQIAINNTVMPSNNPQADDISNEHINA